VDDNEKTTESFSLERPMRIVRGSNIAANVKLSSSALWCGSSGSLESKWADAEKISLWDVHFSPFHLSFPTARNEQTELNGAERIILQLSIALRCSAMDA
jgi:hypothetical protein